MPEALPAVTVPFSFTNTGFIFWKSSILAPARKCSSFSNTTSPLRLLIVTGTIWSLKRFSAQAFSARLWLSTASLSWSSRLIFHLAATFSAVMPMCVPSNGSVSAPTIMSTILLSPMRAPQRAARLAYGPRLMFSAPPPMATSQSPSRMACAAETMACRPEPHSRLTFIATVSLGQPPLMVATRDRYMSLGSVLTTWPNTTCPTSLPSRPARAIDSRTTSAARSVVGTSFRAPPNVPMAVRTALTTTTSRDMMISFLKQI